MAVKKGKTANEDNVGILCSDETGLELVGRTEKGVEFRTTKIRETPEDIQLAARFGAPIPYMIGMNYAEGYRSGTVTFKTDESGRMIPAGTYKLDRAAAQSMDLGPLLQVSSCWENVKEKLRIAGQNAELRLRLASGNTQASAPHHSQDRGER